MSDPIRCHLSNGMELVYQPTLGANAASIQCVVWAGALDELPEQRGSAHFLEHMLFKGTQKRGVGEIASVIEGAGGDINAYTTFDRTVYYVTLPATESDLAFDVLSDAIFDSSFDPEEYLKEREVILEEIRRGNDDPGAQIGKKIFSTLYEGTEAGRPIIGFFDEIAKFPRENLISFWRDWYQPHNMSLVVVGRVDFKDVLAMAEKYFGGRSQKNVKAASWGPGRHRYLKQKPLLKPQVEQIRGDFEQTRFEIIFKAPSLDGPETPEIDLATYALSGSEVSRLPRRLKEEEHLVAAIGASAFNPVFEGLFEISCSLDPENMPSSCRAVGRELAKMFASEPITDLELDRAKAAARLARIHRDETVDGIARGLVTSLATSLKDKFDFFYEKALDAATSHQVTAALKNWWNLKTPLLVLLTDREVKVDSAELVQNFLEGVQEGLKQTSSQGKSVTPVLKAQVYEERLPGGSKLIYRHIPDAKMLSVVAATEGGLRGESLETTGTFHAVATLLGLATKKESYDDFTGRIEDLGAVLGGFSGKDSLGFEMHCAFDQGEEMIERLSNAMLNPHFPETQWRVYQKETLETLKIQFDQPSWVCMRKLHGEIFGNHPYAMPVIGIGTTVQGFTSKALEAFFETWRDAGDWVFTGAGGVEPKTFFHWMKQAFKEFKPLSSKRNFSLNIGGLPSRLNLPQSIRRTQEQAHIALATRGPSWGEEPRASLDLVIHILGGQGGRLFTTLRDEQSLAYSVSPLHSSGVSGGILGAYMASAVDKTDKALKGLREEFQKILQDGPTREEVERARSYVLGSHEISLQRTSSQAMTMALMELYGMGWDDFLKYPDLVRRVTLDDIRSSALSWLDPAKMKWAVVGSS